MDAAAAKPRRRPFLAATPAFAAGTDSPRAFLERCLSVIAEREGEVRAFVVVDIEKARNAADESTQRWRDGRQLSPIDGMPVGVKDIIETIDMPTGMGSPLFEGWRSERDAASVKALREAGAIILGKTVTTEFAAVHPNVTRNPWDLDRTPGGSSSGSAAAVGCGMVSAALGTQVIGSIVRPASFCGCVGFKPTVGAINRGGSHDYLSQSALGVLAADLADAWQVMKEMATRCGGDPGTVGLVGPAVLPEASRPARVAVIRTAGWATASEDARQAFDRACARLAEAGVQFSDGSDDAAISRAEAAIKDAQALSRAINAWESRWPLNTYGDRDFAKLSQPMQERLKQAEAMSQDDYQAAITKRDRARLLHAALADRYEAAITLSAPDAAPLGLASTGDATFAVPASLLGVPAMSLPLLTSGGLPLGLQLIGFSGRDAPLFGLAGWVSSQLS